MKIEDCEVGMGVEPKHDIGAIGVSKGEKLVIRKVEKDTNGGCEGYLYFDGKGHVGVSAGVFEPVNKFEVGDEVIYKSFDSQTIKKRKEAVIFGIAPEKDKLNREYAISYIHEGPYGEKKRVNKMVAEHKLLPLKTPDELEVGDKFKDYSGDKVEILAKENNAVNVIYYFGRTNSGNIDIWNEYDVKEIIYD